MYTTTFSIMRASTPKAGESSRQWRSAMSDLEFPDWQGPYLEALIQSSSQRRSEEQAIENALMGLTFLRRETLESKRSQGELLTTTQPRVN
jgi:hypothetical protein